MLCDVLEEEGSEVPGWERDICLNTLEETMVKDRGNHFFDLDNITYHSEFFVDDFIDVLFDQDFDTHIVNNYNCNKNEKELPKLNLNSTNSPSRSFGIAKELVQAEIPERKNSSDI